MILQRFAEGVWGLTQGSDPALDFMIGIPDDCICQESIHGPAGDPFVSVGYFLRTVPSELIINISLMFLPRDTDAKDLMECILGLSSVTAVQWKPADGNCTYESEVIAVYRSNGSEYRKHIKLVKNAKFVYRIEVTTNNPTSDLSQAEVRFILDSFRLRNCVPRETQPVRYEATPTGAEFAYPSTWRIEDPKSVRGSGVEYILSDHQLECTVRVLVAAKEDGALRIAKDFAEWFRANGLSLRGAPVAEGGPIKGWEKQFVYAPRATRTGGDVSAGVCILMAGGQSLSIGMIGPDQRLSPWKFAVVRRIVDAIIQSARTSSSSSLSERARLSPPDLAARMA